ncbi:MAG: hypothetical protein ACKOUM_04360 [Sphingopyxis sp.]
MDEYFAPPPISTPPTRHQQPGIHGVQTGFPTCLPPSSTARFGHVANYPFTLLGSGLIQRVIHARLDQDTIFTA